MKILLLTILLLSFAGCVLDDTPTAVSAPDNSCSFDDGNISIQGCNIVDKYLQRKYDEQDVNKERECIYFCQDLRDEYFPSTDEQYEAVIEISKNCMDMCYRRYD